MSSFKKLMQEMDKDIAAESGASLSAEQKQQPKPEIDPGYLQQIREARQQGFPHTRYQSNADINKLTHDLGITPKELNQYKDFWDFDEVVHYDYQTGKYSIPEKVRYSPNFGTDDFGEDIDLRGKNIHEAIKAYGEAQKRVDEQARSAWEKREQGKREEQTKLEAEAKANVAKALDFPVSNRFNLRETINSLEKLMERDYAKEAELKWIGSGYSQKYGKSYRALNAETQGKFPASIAAKALGVSVNKLRTSLPVAEWHHSGGDMYNRVDYYDLKPVAEALGNIYEGDPLDESQKEIIKALYGK